MNLSTMTWAQVVARRKSNHKRVWAASAVHHARYHNRNCACPWRGETYAFPGKTL